MTAEGTSPDPTALFGALSDPDCRLVLSTLRRSPMTARELSEALDLPTSTLYRKLDRLSAAGAVEEDIRIRTVGRNSTEYALRLDRIVVSVTGDGSLEIEVSRTDSRREGGPGTGHPLP